jgi:hypothetical protein
MGTPAKLAIDIVVNSRGAKKELDDTSDSVSGLGKTTENSSKGMSAALAGFAGGAAFGAVKAGFDMVVDFIGNSIKAASDLNETTSQTSQIFGDAAPAIEAFASTSASALGLSQRAAKDAANNFATFGKAAGLTGGDLTSFSTDLVTLSADLASFKNTTPEEAANALGAALRGESEPMRKYGVLLDDATLKARAMKMGLISATTDALSRRPSPRRPRSWPRPLTPKATSPRPRAGSPTSSASWPPSGRTCRPPSARRSYRSSPRSAGS